MTQLQRGERLPELVTIMRQLLAPGGCPWDREQTLQTLRPYVIEEAHEVVDAIDRGALGDLREELGDLLLQVVFQSEVSGGAFGIDDVIGAICDKLVRRHPHVFGDAKVADADEVRKRWEALKAQEKKDRGVLDGVPLAMPSLLRAVRVAEKAAHLGLDWADARGPREKLDEELAELDEAIDAGQLERVEAEFGDVLFALVSVARKHAVDPDAALRRTIATFCARVGWVEAESRARAVVTVELPPTELDALWQEAKEATRG